MEIFEGVMYGLCRQNKGRVEYTLERESELNAEGQRIVHAY